MEGTVTSANRPQWLSMSRLVWVVRVVYVTVRWSVHVHSHGRHSIVGPHAVMRHGHPRLVGLQRACSCAMRGRGRDLWGRDRVPGRDPSHTWTIHITNRIVFLVFVFGLSGVWRCEQYRIQNTEYGIRGLTLVLRIQDKPYWESVWSVPIHNTEYDTEYGPAPNCTG